jgi:hypothetical protein
MTYDRKFVLCAFGYAIFGMCVGIYMGESMNHKQLVTHAHVLLVGFVVSFIYGLIHKLWLFEVRHGLARIQFYLHNVAAVAMFSGLFLRYGDVLPEATVGPILGASSVGVLAGALLMMYMILVSPGSKLKDSLES